MVEDKTVKAARLRTNVLDFSNVASPRETTRAGAYLQGFRQRSMGCWRSRTAGFGVSSHFKPSGRPKESRGGSVHFASGSRAAGV